ncbi:MAG: NINE protein [Thermoguttaceae bacterium]|nr:NINE protein [Thermoguttaceae bacterium]
MFCRNCGSEVQGFAVACMKCGCNPHTGKAFCPNCGAHVNENQVVCVKCGGALTTPNKPASSKKTKSKKSRVTAGLLGLFLGLVGANQFYLENTTSALLHLAISVCTCGWGGMVIGAIEGIIYLTKSDEEFDETYVQNKRGWF